MAKAVALAVLLVAVAAALLAVAPAPARAVCNMSNDEFMKCQPAAAATSNPTTNPSAGCCSALSHADLNCLCSYKNSPWLSIYNIDPNRAMQLPAKCGLTMPANC
uniref:Bifunctional inhibitor/plant lipid transfer protein/seed storage helical domain-containing protein n=1 Tax=Oryza rufipogon TaxID=4529 RepID=A0A0E0Q6R6_ORYRU